MHWIVQAGMYHETGMEALVAAPDMNPACRHGNPPAPSCSTPRRPPDGPRIVMAIEAMPPWAGA